MKKFYTITSEHTIHTNDRSTRFDDKDAAVRAASNRLYNHPEVDGVIILEAVVTVRRVTPQVEVIPID